MELKPYQQDVLNDLESYLGLILEKNNYAKAFDEHWESRLGPYNPLEGKGMEKYQDDVPGAPHVCIKVPTAGGKTFIASNAIELIYRYYPEQFPRTVVWLVPSVTILEQTVRNLSDPSHPYRQRINAHFSNRVEVFRKEDLLQGSGFNATSVKEQLNILVLSFDSLRTRNKEGRKFYQENGQLASFADTNENTRHVLEGTDETALINVIRKLNPVVIVDEAHGAVSDLSVEMLKNLKPSFILDLTATPRKNSNIISFVNALKLKKEHMVKLPVIVYNHQDRNGVIESAINLRNKLEAEAIKEESGGGKYIRPIVLFQAQPKTSEDNTTFDKIKQILLELGIPKEQVCIKTANINELKDVDLMSNECEIRYIITVNALKEGWDCPFAYILASLADKSSAVDVEQILGRVLRQPYVKQHQFELLNYSFVITASAKFKETLNNIVEGLNRAGFSRQDYKIVEENVTDQPITVPVRQLILDTESAIPIENEIKKESITIHTSSGETDPFIRSITEKATAANEEMRVQVEQSEKSGFDLPVEIQHRVKTYAMKDLFAEKAKQIRLPMFFIKLPRGGFLIDDVKFAPLNKDSLLDGFRLSLQESNISFEKQDPNLYKVDLEQTTGDQSKPVYSKLDDHAQQSVVEYLLQQPKEVQIKQLAGRLTRLLGNYKPIADKEVSLYVQRIVEGFTTEQIKHAMYHELSYNAAIKEKIKSLSEAYAEKQFNVYLDTDQIIAQPQFSLLPAIQPARLGPSVAKSLYEAEAHMNDFEERVISAIANVESVEFWHRNMEHRGFMINGFINHYPDFIVQMKSGKILLIESKGEHLDGEDSKAKIRLGNKWAQKAGENYKYYMVFEQKEVEGALTLNDLLARIKQL